jgi:hypothetical protein
MARVKRNSPKLLFEICIWRNLSKRNLLVRKFFSQWESSSHCEKTFLTVRRTFSQADSVRKITFKPRETRFDGTRLRPRVDSCHLSFLQFVLLVIHHPMPLTPIASTTPSPHSSRRHLHRSVVASSSEEETEESDTCDYSSSLVDVVVVFTVFEFASDGISPNGICLWESSSHSEKVLLTVRKLFSQWEELSHKQIPFEEFSHGIRSWLAFQSFWRAGRLIAQN